MTIDVLLPYWGDPGHMKEAVASVLAQEDTDWRMVVVDDCYPDPWLGPWLATLDDPRITYHRNEVNAGITGNYRRCLSLATADVVVFMGCDDLMLPNYLATIRAAHRDFPEADVIQPGVRVIDENGTPVRSLVDTVKQRLTMPRVRTRRLLAGEELALSLLRADWMYWPSLAFSRERLVRTPFRDDFPIIQDLALVIDIVTDGGSLLLDATDCFRYRRHSASASSASLLDGRRFAGERQYFRMAIGQVSALGWTRAARTARRHITSRLHALTLLPTAAAARSWSAVGGLLRHALLPLRPEPSAVRPSQEDTHE